MNYETTDINLTGFLMASGVTLVSHRSENGRTFFYLEQTDQLQELIDGYFNMTLPVIPLRYGGALKILKNILYQKNHDYYNGKQRISNQIRKGQ